MTVNTDVLRMINNKIHVGDVDILENSSKQNKYIRKEVLGISDISLDYVDTEGN